MKALVLAGGSGTRLWPLSRKNFPKQFLKVKGDKSLLRQTVDRLLKVLSRDDILVMTNSEYKFYVKSDLGEIDHIILEPEGRNTAPAIVLGIKYCMEKFGCDEDEAIFISPSDHIISPVDSFVKYFRMAEAIAKKGYILTFGIRPDRPETGYGYIKANMKSPDGSGQTGYFQVEEFVEKPDLKNAMRYLEEGNYFWNSGMFAFSIGTILAELENYSPKIRNMFDKSFDEMVVQFHQMPKISIDYAIMEKSRKVVVVPFDFYWNDIGSWDSLHEIFLRDENGNAAIGEVMTIDTKNCLIFGNKRLLSTIGLKDCIIVETSDAVLVTKKGEAWKVKEIVNRLMEGKRKEASEHITSFRPWGSYKILEQGLGYKIKRVVVNPSQKISLQKHVHRSEHWVVVKGMAKVTIGNKKILIHENESAYVPKATLHRLENTGKVPVEIIEVQNGEYLEEDDIERFEDDYGR